MLSEGEDEGTGEGGLEGHSPLGNLSKLSAGLWVGEGG